MKVLYFDCFLGISGSMVLGACLELGVEKNFLMNELRKLSIDGWNITVKSVKREGISALDVEVCLEKHEQGFLRYQDILNILEESQLNKRIKQQSRHIFHRIAKAEAKIRKTTTDQVHFPVARAMNDMIDIVGTAICMDWLKPDKIYCSAVKEGVGCTYYHDGIIPVPAPVTMELLTEKKIPLKQINVECELVTPTGAAILAELVNEYCLMPEMQIHRIGYGTKTTKLSIPYLLRIVEGLEKSQRKEDYILVMQSNIDDCSPEILAYTMEQLFEAGANDVFYSFIGMKKSRQAICMTILCEESKREAMEKILFTETTTIGLRYHLERRTILPRKIEEIETKYGKLKVKHVHWNQAGEGRIYPEYESAKLLAKEHGVPLIKVYQEVYKKDHV